MTRAIQIAGLMVLEAISGLSDQGGGKPAKVAPPPPPRVGAGRPNAPPLKGGAGGVRKTPNGPKLPNPLANPVQRLIAMPPEKRERVLEKLPAQQQIRMRQALENFDRRPEAEKARWLQYFQRFSSLPPERQQILTHQLTAFNSLSEERRTILATEFVQLSRMPDSERQARINSEEFKNKFSPTELQMLSDISRDFPFPGR